MTVWRWMVSITLLVGVVFLADLPSSAQDKKDDKAAADKKDDTKKKDETKKTEEKKVEEKKAEEKTSAGSDFKSFDEKSGPFYQTVKTSTTQVMKVQGQEVKQVQDQTFTLGWTPKAKSGEDYVVVQKILAVKMDIDIAGNKVSYDSTATNQPRNPMTEFFQALVGSELTLTIDKELNVKKIEGADKLVEKLSQGNKQLEPLLKSILSDDALKQMAVPSWGAYPIAGKKNWERTSDLKLPGIGTYKTTYNYTQESDEKVKIDAKLTYSAPGADRGALPFTIKDGSSLTTKNATGAATLDKAKGRITDSKMTMELEGNLKIDVAGMETDVNLSQTQVTEVKASDTNPVAAPAKK
ncbi:MAG: hypothetical protein K2X38_06090 [Gemmataceae bacterium]|nr:hypothetical protein [Gemmataceae bacterium]